MAEHAEDVVELVNVDIPRAESSSPTPIVRQVNWRIERGSFWVVGAFAGAGKTDLLLTAAGLQRPISGEVRVFGRSLRHMGEEELISNRLKVAMVFDNGRLFSHLTIAENISLPLRYHHHSGSRDIAEKVNAALETTALAEFSDQLPRQVPRPLHQRVALARALALSPEVLFIDNPLGGIDQRGTRWWIDFLCAVHAGDPKMGRFTLVIASDDLRPWIDTAKSFGVVRDGRFETIGGKEQLQQTSEPIVRELLTDAFETS